MYNIIKGTVAYDMVLHVRVGEKAVIVSYIVGKVAYGVVN